MRALAPATMLLLLAASATAGTRVHTETRVLRTEPARTERASLWIDGHLLRLDAAGGKSSVIYDAQQESAWVLDHGDKTFVKVDRGTTTAVSRKLDQANQQLRDRLEGLPPEQRQAMERLLDGTLGPQTGAEPAITTRDTGERDLVEGIPCDELEVWRGEERVAELCRADFQSAGVDPARFDVVRELATFLRESVSSLAPESWRREGLEALETLDGLEGIPMRVRAYEEGALASETVVRSIDEVPVDASRFDVPAGYRGGFSLDDFQAAPPAAGK